MGDGIPWSILVPVAGGAGVLAFQFAGGSLSLIRGWVVATLGLSFAALSLLGESVSDAGWTRAVLAIVCAAGVAAAAACGPRLEAESESEPDSDDSVCGRFLALMLFSLAAFAVTCQTGSLAGLLAAHAAFLIVVRVVVRGSPDPARASTAGLHTCMNLIQQNEASGRPSVDDSAGSGDPRTTTSMTTAFRSRRGERQGRSSYLFVLSFVLLVAGFGFLIALGGSHNLDAVQRSLSNSYQPVREEITIGTASILGTVSFVLILTGAAIPFAAFPFQFDQSNLFQEQPVWLVGWVAIAGRAQAFVLLWRIAVTTMPGFGPQVQTPLLVLAAGSALVGACLACRSLSLRELAGNCWLVHGGLLLHCVATGAGQVSIVRDDPRWQLPSALETGVLVFACSSAALIVLLLIEANLALPSRRQEFDEDLAGLVRQLPSTGGALATGLLAFCAVPPLASFWGVVYLGAGAFVPQYEASDSDILVPNGAVVVTAVVLVASLLILAARIVRLLSLMFFDEPLRRHRPAGGVSLLLAGVLAAVLLLGGILPGPLLRAIHSAM